MASRIIDATLKLVDKFSTPLHGAMQKMEQSSKQMKRLAKDYEYTGKKVTNVGKTLTTGITLPVVAAGVASFKAASDMQESINKVDVSFGKNSENIKKWSKTTLEKYGLAQGTALDMAATFGDMGTGMGFSTEKAANMAQGISGLAADMASFKNISVDVAKTALTSIFTGETESLKQLGIVMTENNLQAYAQQSGFMKSRISAQALAAAHTKVEIAQGRLSEKIKKYGKDSLQAKVAQASLTTALEKQSKVSKGSIRDLSEAEKVQLRYNYVMDKAKNSQGDFARTSSSAANQQRIFTEGVKQLSASIGQKLLPAGTRFIAWANKLVKNLNSLNSGQQNSILKFALFAAAIGPVIMMVGAMVTGTGKAIEAFRLFSIAMKTFRTESIVTATLAAPLIVGAVLVIAGIAFLVIKNWKQVKAFFGSFVNYLKGRLSACGVDFKKLGKAMESAKASISRSINNLRPVFSKIAQFAKPVLTFLAGVWLARIKVVFGALIGFLSGWISSVSGVVSSIIKVFEGITIFVSGVFTGNWRKAWEGVKMIFKNVFASFVGIAKAPLNIIMGMVKGIINTIKNIKLPSLGGLGKAIKGATVPKLAGGTNNWGGGIVQVSERGGEIIDLPSRSRVYPHDKSVEMARAEGAQSAGKTVNLNISKLADNVTVRSDSDIDKLAQKFADEIEKRMNNMGRVVMV